MEKIERLSIEKVEIEEDGNKFVAMFQSFVTDHGNIVTLLIFLPLILTVLYILLVEKSPL